MTKRDLVVASTRHHRVRLLKHYPRRPCTPSFVKSRTLRPLQKHISYFFNKYSFPLCVYTRGLLGCLGQNPAGAINYYRYFQAFYNLKATQKYRDWGPSRTCETLKAFTYTDCIAWQISKTSLPWPVKATISCIVLYLFMRDMNNGHFITAGIFLEMTCKNNSEWNLALRMTQHTLTVCLVHKTDHFSESLLL